MEVGTRESLLRQKKYHAKVLLFGEHLVLDGASSLAIPLPTYTGSWSSQESTDDLTKFLDFLLHLPFIPSGVLKILRQSGLNFISDIPRGYGVGSSGALCAAVYEYIFPSFREKKPLLVLKELAMMEGFFHGRSSGLDAYVILMDKPVLFQNGNIEKVSFKVGDFPQDIYLLDSGKKRSSKDMIKGYLSNTDSHLKSSLIDLNNDIVERALFSEKQDFVSKIKEMSRIQFSLFSPMIVDSVQSYWKYGLTSGSYSIKLCGAGGGGYYLAIGPEDAIKNIPLKSIKIN